MAANPEYPFLSLQMNSFLRKIKNDSYSMEEANAPLLYRKPSEIAQPISNALPQMWHDQRRFSADWRARIAAYVTSYGLGLKVIRNGDTPRIKAFLNRRYPQRLADEICAFDLYRFHKFGHGVILEGPDQEVMGTIFEVGYHTPEMTSYTIRLAVDESLKGKNLGYHLMIYSCLLAMDQGSRVKRGLIEYNNLRSLHINLNKVGWICDGFEPAISELGCFFEIALPLDPMGLTGNCINFSNTLAYLASHRAGIDYRLLPTGDKDALFELYHETDFKICALLKPGMVSDRSTFLALPADTLRLRKW
jgi:hypothetical protein